MSEPISSDPSSRLGEPIFRFQQLDSTNTTARQMAIAGAIEGTAVVARRQTAGRGRQGRSWDSPPDEGLYLSLILKPRVSLARASFLTLAAAIAVAETLALDFHTPADIKYPNDILVEGRKICGILVESASEGGRLQYAILGIGVNVAQQQFPDELKASATSLRLASGVNVTPDDFLSPLLAHLNIWYPLSVTQPERIIKRWEELSSYAYDARITLISDKSSSEGMTRGLADNGALRVEFANGEVREIVAGEIHIRKV